MEATVRHTKTRSLIGLSVATAATILLVGIWTSGEETATADASVAAWHPVTAMQGMAAMKNRSLIVREMPALVRNLPADMRAEPGTVRRLAVGLGTSKDLTVYVWPRGAGSGVCLVSTTGGGGCLGSFNRPFDISITDADQLGAGAPAAVWGPVADDVVSVAITADGITGHATIRNNIAYYELAPDALPSEVQKVTVTLRDGRIVPIRV